MKAAVAAPAALVLAAALLTPLARAAPLDETEIRRRVETAYGVKVLRIEPLPDDKAAAQLELRVKVMSTQPDANGAFGVTTLVIDAETGQPVPQFRHRPSGYDLPDTLDPTPRQDIVPKPEHGTTWR